MMLLPFVNATLFDVSRHIILIKAVYVRDMM